MKITHILTVFCALSLVACVPTIKVKAVVAPDVSSSIQLAKPPAKLSDLPKNITAVCRDGKYSIAKDDTACLGNGGIKIAIKRYYSE